MHLPPVSCKMEIWETFSMNDFVTAVTLSWRVNSSYNAPVINYQLEFQELPKGQWIVVNIPAKVKAVVEF